MQRSELLAVTKRVLDCLENRLPRNGRGGPQEPATVFTDPERFAAERAMLRRVPHVVGWAGEVRSPGDLHHQDVDGTAVLIVRDDSGTLRAFVNACTHRGGGWPVIAGTHCDSRADTSMVLQDRWHPGRHPFKRVFSGVDQTALA